MSVVFLPQAERDLREALGYLAERSPTGARALGERIAALVAALDAGAFEGPEVTLRSGGRVRTWPVPPLRVYYQRRGDVLYVVRVYHQARRPLG